MIEIFVISQPNLDGNKWQSSVYVQRYKKQWLNLVMSVCVAVEKRDSRCKDGGVQTGANWLNGVLLRELGQVSGFRMR